MAVPLFYSMGVGWGEVWSSERKKLVTRKTGELSLRFFSPFCQWRNHQRGAGLTLHAGKGPSRACPSANSPPAEEYETKFIVCRNMCTLPKMGYLVGI